MIRKFSIADPGENDFTPVLVGVAGYFTFFNNKNNFPKRLSIRKNHSLLKHNQRTSRGIKIDSNKPRFFL